MGQVYSVKELAKLGTILGIWAHPDDETFTSAGLMAAAVQNGQTVACVTATKGEAGVQDPLRWPATTLASTRALELIEALQILGISHHAWLGYADGGCAKVADAEAVAKLLPFVQQYQPDTIITFPPDGITGHPDHKTVSRWAGLVAAKSPKPVRVIHGVTTVEAYNGYLKEMDAKLNIYFNIDQPVLYPKNACDIIFDLPEDILQKKCQSFQHMPSQTAIMLENFSFDYLCKAFASECFVYAN